MTSKLSRRGAIRMALVFMVALAAAPLGQDRPASDLAQPLDHVPGEVLVKFAPGTPPGLVNRALVQMSGQHLRTFTNIGAHHWRAGRGVSTEQALAVLASPAYRDYVEYAEPNYIRHTTQSNPYPDDPLRGDLWALHNIGQTGGKVGADIGAIATWTLSDLATPTVAVIDTGVDYTHPDLGVNMWTDTDGSYGKNFVDATKPPMDDNGHGTHVAGTIAAVRDNGVGVVGVGWPAKIMALKFLNAAGSGSDANAILAIQYAEEHGATIMNASWGGSRASSALYDAVRNCGCLFIAAAGNSGNSKVLYPAAYNDLPNLISVAATDHTDALAPFSTYSSTKVDLAAPGVKILSTYRGGVYRTLDGTSMATPHVSGVAALLVAAGQAVAPADLKRVIRDSADRLPALAGKVATGGRLSAAAALGGTRPTAETTPPDEPSGLTVVESAQNSVTFSWIAGGDNGPNGMAYLYDLRYSTSAITDSNWESATPATGEPWPCGANTAQSFELTGLDAGTEYYVGLRAADVSGNYSSLATATARTASGPKWVVESIVDPLGPSSSAYLALAFDSNGNPAVAYSQANPSSVRFAIKLDGSWHFSTADAGGPGIDLAFDEVGNPAISHGWGKLRFAEGAAVGASWQSRVLETGPKNDITSLIFHDGEPRITYQGGGNTPPLKLIRRVGTSWIAETVDTNAGHYSSLAFDTNGNATVAYSADANGDGYNDSLKFARRTVDGTGKVTWNTEVVETGLGYGALASLAYHPSLGYPAIVHTAYGKIRFARWDGQTWKTEAVASGNWASLAFDPDGLPTISYGTTDDKVWWTKRGDDGTWQTEVVDRASDAAYVTRLKFDKDGNPCVLYTHYIGKELRLACRVWQQ